MFFEQVRVGGDRNFSYVVADEITKTAIIFDPAFEVHRIDEILEKKEFNLRYIIMTHSHDDHVNGLSFFKQKYPDAESVMIIATDYPVDIQVEDETVWDVDAINLKFMHTPGHHKDCMCILVNDKKLITGDTLFVGKIGGTGPSFPTSDARLEYDSLQKIITLIPDDVEVWPGHDYGKKKSSTIKYEKENNPFLKMKNYEGFLWLKDNWLQYKKEHGIK